MLYQARQHLVCVCVCVCVCVRASVRACVFVFVLCVEGASRHAHGTPWMVWDAWRYTFDYWVRVP